MNTHPIFDADMSELVDSFLAESRAILADVATDLASFRQDPADAAAINRMIRAMRTVKGTAGFLSLEQLSFLAHQVENTLKALLNGQVPAETAVTDLLATIPEQMGVLLDQVEARELTHVDLSQTLDGLEAILAGDLPAETSASPDPKNDAPDEAVPAEEELSTEAPDENRANPDAEAPAAPSQAAETTPAPAPTSDGEAEPEDDAEAVIAQVLADAPRPDPEHLANHPMFAPDLEEIVESFIIESREVFDDLTNDLLSLEQTPHDLALIDQIFRAVHTVKGTAGFLSFSQLSYLTHHFEDVLNLMRRGTLAYQPFMMDVILAAFDQMKVLTQQVEERRLAALDLAPVLRQLKLISLGRTPDGAAAPAPAAPPPSDEAPDGAAAQSATRRSDRSTDTIRVEIDRLDSLMNLVGELVLGRNRLMQLVTDLDHDGDHLDLLHALTETTSQVDFITTELQSAVMHTRMVQIGRVFNKFPRVVRDLAKEFDKEIRLELEGEETELDKSLIEEINDPMVHLIRNACDHGIEMPEDRVAAGKPAHGTIRLVAMQEGNNVVIKIEDDGPGIDPEKLKAKAIEKGYITQKEADEMSDAEAYQLIFRPGFSMAKKVSSVSGRGVGMDVVKTNIARLNGSISIQSELGKGTTFQLKLPLTLAIIQSLLVRIQGETYAVPLHSVSEVVGLDERSVSTINHQPVIRLREEVLPLVHVRRVLGLPAPPPDAGLGHAVIVHIGHRRVGLVVDELIGQKEIVIKPLGSYLKKIPGIAGSTILGDGRVIMILDIGETIKLAREAKGIDEARLSAVTS